MILIGYFLLFATILILAFMALSSVELGMPARSRRFKKTGSSLDDLERKSREYEESFIFITPEKLKSKRLSTMSLFLLLGAAGFPIGGLVPGFILMAVLGTAGYFLPILTVKHRIETRRTQFNSQILDMLETVSNGLKAGLSFVQALEAAAVQLPDPMGQELQYTLRQHSLGVNIDDALTKMSERMKVSNFDLVVSAITVTRQLGGNLPEIFKNISETIRERETMEGKVTALTSQGRMQAMLMGAMPFILMIGIYFLDKKTIMPLFTNPIGWGLLTVMIVLNTVGFLFIRKIVNFEY
jgi:tight adherence protein B